MYINTEKKEKEKKGQLFIMCNDKHKKKGQLSMVCNDNTNRERNKKKWVDSLQFASDKKKKISYESSQHKQKYFFLCRE